jgi:alpha/beta superfamily hydrolase
MRIQTRDPAVSLEADLINTSSETAYILSHPWGWVGGDLRNNVTSSLFHHFNQSGSTCIRYNMRGVGKSSGSGSWTGIPESEGFLGILKIDLEDVCFYLVESNPSIKNIILVGYSYGAMITAATLRRSDLPIKAAILISLPYSVTPFLSRFNSSQYV